MTKGEYRFVYSVKNLKLVTLQRNFAKRFFATISNGEYNLSFLSKYYDNVKQ